MCHHNSLDSFHEITSGHQDSWTPLPELVFRI
jgi:hypothetical protein